MAETENDIVNPAPATPKKTKRPAGKATGAKKGGQKKKKKRRSPFMRLMRGLFLTLSIVAAAALVCTGYAGHISPLQHGGLPAILPLCFPLTMLGAAVLLVLQLVWHWRGVIIVAAAFLASAGPALQICPLNVHFGERKAPEGSDVVKLLTYNVYNFSTQKEDPDSLAPNHALDFILETDADIACIQESLYLSPSCEFTHITTEQLQRLHRQYPYIIISSSGSQMCISKYPITPIHISVTKAEFDDAELTAYRIELPGGKLMTLFNVHLQSLNLNKDDKALYHKLTEMKRENMSAVREQLIDKLKFANVERARQVQALMRFIRHYGGPDVVVCGDFNDVATCYTMHTLEDAGFRSMYAELGFGPIITYNSNRFYFGIDHILYRGDFTPLSIEKGTLRASDHYPLVATFAIK